MIDNDARNGFNRVKCLLCSSNEYLILENRGKRAGRHGAYQYPTVKAT